MASVPEIVVPVRVELTVAGPPVMAKDVQVDKIFRARCRRPGCGWTGDDQLTFRHANDERQAHLNWHAMGAPE